MITLLTKTIRRQIPQEFDRRNWVVEVHPWGLRFRAKRCKQTFDCTWGQAWNKAQMNHVEAVRAEKKAARKVRAA